MVSEGDLATLPRAKLISEGLKSIQAGRTTEGLLLFGAAIRRAKTIGLWDIEAEFFKFVTLYRQGDYGAAVQRCVKCLDRVKMFHDAAKKEGKDLPQDVLIVELEATLTQAMVRRGDGFFALLFHFMNPGNGEYYLLKKPRGFVEAFIAAWQALSRQSPVDYELLKNEFRLFSAFLQDKLFAADKADAGNAVGATASPNAEIQNSVTAIQEAESKVKKELPKDEEDYRNQLQSFVQKGYMSLSEEEIDRVFTACRLTQSHQNMNLIAELLDSLGPNSKKQYIAALAGNNAFSGTGLKFTNPRANVLYDEVRNYASVLNN